MKRIISLACVSLLVPALAVAQPKSADAWYKEGETAYNLGKLPEAIAAFMEAFKLETSKSKRWAYIYNIAQAYRFLKDCAQAKFFYKRYVGLREEDKSKPFDAAHRAEIEARIRDLEECERKAEAVKDKPPEGPMTSDGDVQSNSDSRQNDTKGDPKSTTVGQAGGDDGEDGEDDDDLVVRKRGEAPPKLLSVRLVAGAAKISATDQVNFPVQATGALIAGYPLTFDKLTLELGAGFTFTPLPYENMPSMMPATDESAQLFGLIANVGATYAVMPKLGLRGDVGLGALFFTGISNSLFTDYAPTSGALSMFHLRIGLSADYALTPNIIATVTPIAFSYSPAKEGLREDIASIRALDFMVGLGYRM